MMLPDLDGMSGLSGRLGWSADDRIEAWTVAIAQAQTLSDCTRLDYDCIHAIEIAVKRGYLRSRSIPQAQAMLATRRAEIIAELAFAGLPSVPGGNPATTEAIGQAAPAIKEQHQW